MSYICFFFSNKIPVHQYAVILQVAFCLSWSINDYPVAICNQDTADSDISHKLHTETHGANLFRVQTLM